MAVPDVPLTERLVFHLRYALGQGEYGYGQIVFNTNETDLMYRYGKREGLEIQITEPGRNVARAFLDPDMVKRAFVFINGGQPGFDEKRSRAIEALLKRYDPRVITEQMVQEEILRQ